MAKNEIKYTAIKAKTDCSPKRDINAPVCATHGTERETIEAIIILSF